MTPTKAAAADVAATTRAAGGNEITRQAISPKATSTSIAAEATARALPRERGHLPTWWRGRDALAADVGKLAGRRLSDQTMRRLEFAIANGCPELRDALDQGRLSIAAAAVLAVLPHDLQREVLILASDRRRLVVRILRNERDDRGDERP